MSTWDRLARHLHGKLILPQQPAYEPWRRWITATVDEVVPRAVAVCATASDVATAIRFAQDEGIPFALRGGGNSTAGYSCTEGLLIDFTAFDDVTLSGDGSRVTVGAGVRAGLLNRRLARTGKIVPLVWMPTVGVVGSALGGGFGPLSRRFGLTCDRLVGAEAVLASGEIVTVSAEQHPDLWWALRGAGGGSFAAITNISLGTRKACPAVDFALRWEPRHAVAVIDAWQHWAPHTTLDVNAELVLQAPANPGDPPVLVLFGLALGAEAAARKELTAFTYAAGVAPHRATFVALRPEEVTTGYNFAGEPVAEAITGGRPHEVQPGYRVIKSEFVSSSLPRKAITSLVDFLLDGRKPGQHRELEFVAWPGSAHGVPDDESAFVHRSASLLVNHVCVCFGDKADKLAARRWATASKAIVSLYGTGHVYQNYPDPDLLDWQNAYYGTNLERLEHVKACYDPQNAFTFPQAITPLAVTVRADRAARRPDTRGLRPL